MGGDGGGALAARTEAARRWRGELASCRPSYPHPTIGVTYSLVWYSTGRPPSTAQCNGRGIVYTQHGHALARSLVLAHARARRQRPRARGGARARVFVTLRATANPGASRRSLLLPPPSRCRRGTHTAERPSPLTRLLRRGGVRRSTPHRVSFPRYQTTPSISWPRIPSNQIILAPNDPDPDRPRRVGFDGGAPFEAILRSAPTIEVLALIFLCPARHPMRDCSYVSFSSSIKQRSKFKRHKHFRSPAAAVGPRERQPARAGGATPRARAAEGAVGGARGRRTGRGSRAALPPSRPSARGRARGRPALGLRRCTTAAAGSEQPGCEKIVREQEESNNNNNNKQQQTTTAAAAAACRGGRSRRWRPAPRRPPRPTAHAPLPPPLRPRTARTRIRSLRATTPQRATTTATGRRCRAPRRSARG